MSGKDVKDEIFDMVKPQDPLRITFQDLVNCGVGHTIVSMLTDVSGFWAYDNRETLLGVDADDEQLGAAGACARGRAAAAAIAGTRRC